MSLIEIALAAIDKGVAAIAVVGVIVVALYAIRERYK